MARYVTIDRGNTSAKVSVWTDDRICYTISGPALSLAMACDIKTRFAHIDAAALCSVAHVDEDFIEALKKVCRRIVELKHDTPMPLRIEYASPATLGTDRIAAMLGAMQLMPGKSLLVVDAGTAVTYDAVSADGRFTGGCIAPGVHMRLASLHGMTARLPLVGIDGPVPPMGHDTATALRTGAVMGVVAEIEHYCRLCGPQTTVVLTGGDAHLVAPLLGDISAIVAPDLVHMGLKSII